MHAQLGTATPIGGRCSRLRLLWTRGRCVGYALSRELLVLGFNHNLQSSYGVTSQVIDAIRHWVGNAAIEVLRPHAALIA